MKSLRRQIRIHRNVGYHNTLEQYIKNEIDMTVYGLKKYVYKDKA